MTITTQPREEILSNNRGIEVSPELLKKFWQRVRKPIGSNEGCWQWMGPVQNRGFGVFHLGKNKKISANRFAWELENGRAGKHVLVHDRKRCNNRGCVRPDHQEKLTPRAAGKRRGLTDALRSYQEVTEPEWSLQPPRSTTAKRTHSTDELLATVLEHYRLLGRGIREVLVEQRKLVAGQSRLNESLLRHDFGDETGPNESAPDGDRSSEGRVPVELTDLTGGDQEITAEDQLWREFHRELPSSERSEGERYLLRSLDHALMLCSGDAKEGLATFKQWILDYAEWSSSGQKKATTRSFEKRCQLWSNSQTSRDTCPESPTSGPTSEL